MAMVDVESYSLSGGLISEDGGLCLMVGGRLYLHKLSTICIRCSLKLKLNNFKVFFS